jgi:hypothetical protein
MLLLTTVPTSGGWEQTYFYWKNPDAARRIRRWQPAGQWSECAPRWASEWASGWVSEWVSEWVREWVSEWASEWVSEWNGERERVSTRQHVKMCSNTWVSVTVCSNFFSPHACKQRYWKTNTPQGHLVLRRGTTNLQVVETLRELVGKFAQVQYACIDLRQSCCCCCCCFCCCCRWFFFAGNFAVWN